MSPFTSWFECSVTCGGGTQNRTRIVTRQPAHGGKDCPLLTESQACGTSECPVDCEVGEWGVYTACSSSVCGPGVKVRTRGIVTKSKFGGAVCPKRQQYADCTVRECPQPCVFEMGPWGVCTAECGGGTQSRSSTSIPPRQECQQDPEQRVCNAHVCPTPAPTLAPTIAQTLAPQPVPTAAPTPVPSRVVVTLPVINVVGGNIVTVEASTHAAGYTDAGAQCIDPLEGDLTSKIESVGASAVSMTPSTKPAFVTYTCENSQGGKQTAIRTVFVEDNTCPVCTVKGKSEAIVEASFPFHDEGVQCVDNFSADVQSFTSGHVDVESVGTYKLTYKARDDAGNWNNGDAPHGQTCLHPSGPLVRTVTVVDTLKPIIALRYKDNLIHTPKASELGSETGTESAETPLVSDRQSAIDDLSMMAIAGTQQRTAFRDEEVVYAMATIVTALALVGYASSRLSRSSRSARVDV